MANPEHLEKLREGVETWNAWRSANPKILPDLSNANLSIADLTGANLSGTNLLMADITGAHLAGANLSHATLTGANLSRAELAEADLCGADLSLVNLSKASCYRVNLATAIFDQTVLGNVDLSEVKGLESVVYHGPSTIGIDTFFKSKGKIPEAFLKGAGVPDSFIKYASSLAGAAFEFYSAFISYSSKDEELAVQLHADLQAHGVRCWYAPEDLIIGDKTRVEIDRAIRGHDKLLLLLSTHSILSDWVEKEVETAFERERRDKRTILFPVRLDDAIMDAEEGWAADIRRQRHIGDFSNWKNHDAYQRAFARLLRDLKASKVAAPATAKV